MKRIGVSRRILVVSPAFATKHGKAAALADLGKLPILHQERQGGNIWHLTAEDRVRTRCVGLLANPAGDRRKYRSASFGEGPKRSSELNMRQHSLGKWWPTNRRTSLAS
jgi:hypothetical protein